MEILMLGLITLIIFMLGTLCELYYTSKKTKPLECRIQRCEEIINSLYEHFRLDYYRVESKYMVVDLTDRGEK